MRPRVSRIASSVSRQCKSAGCGMPSACLISLAFPSAFVFAFAFCGDVGASVASDSTLTCWKGGILRLELG